MAKKSTTEKALKKAPAAKSARKKGRFLGWQTTPYTQAAFGSTTKGGKNNQSFKILASTGSVQETKPQWFLVDASKAPIGRLATTIASILMGKYRPTFSWGAGSGDCVVVINADKAYFTSDKAEKKIYYSHSLYMGGLKSQTAKQMMQKNPDQVIWFAVQGMMPKNKLSRYQLPLLKICKGADHPHRAQKPIEVVFEKPLKKLLVSNKAPSAA